VSVHENSQHVVFGAGQVGRALAAHLAGQGQPVRVVSRHQPIELLDGAEWRGADATDPEAATEATKGATVVYQCLNAPYTKWAEQFPPLQRGLLAAAERNGALLVSLENLYGYGPTHGKPMTEDLPLVATLGTDERAIDGVWHLPGPETVTTRQVLDLVAGEVGHPVGIRSVPKLALRGLGLVNPMMRALTEMAYEFDEPFVLDTTKYQTTFGPAGTTLPTAIATTVDGYRAMSILAPPTAKSPGRLSAAGREE
jgi:hypothetical protein